MTIAMQDLKASRTRNLGIGALVACGLVACGGSPAAGEDVARSTDAVSSIA